MLSPFFHLAAVSPTRQSAFRCFVVNHVLILSLYLLVLIARPNRHEAVLLGQVLLVAGVVEGALLLGWRLTQLPKSQALEFLLVSPLRPGTVFLGECLVGLARLALVTLSGLPLLVLMVEAGFLAVGDLLPLLLMPLVWGAFTGLVLTSWAYETDGVRRVGERVLLVCILLYLVIGVLAGENLATWLSCLPAKQSASLLNGFRFFHEYNPFGAMKFAMEVTPAWGRERILLVAAAGTLVTLVLLGRGAWRLQGHFHDRHYRPNTLDKNVARSAVGDQPLAWWAVKRVTEYSGRINLWLAGGFGILYAAYTIAQASWPSWLGKQAFVIFDQMGGVPVVATALVLLAAVPAAFQYGLWDSNAQDRCRRLELLLLTRLDAFAYWQAAAAAAWTRGKGYFAVAGLLWCAAAIAGTMTVAQVAISASAGVVLWGLYFALGFRAFSRGHQANLLGLVLTLGLPMLAYFLYQSHLPLLAGLVPPGSVYQASVSEVWMWLPGPLLGGLAALLIGRNALARCDAELRRWYDRHHGARVMD